ncbi:hypothetical protein DYB28_005325 [Aphanomyces astaci]|uniref:Uncharacterized protein n=1 Tax=Aphanomyces astaci TaxID=112090 RepID=A0A9X8DXR3_APHAT|nr:hypothetical protein DYB28_005325 [Aphanomyces astaci]
MEFHTNHLYGCSGRRRFYHRCVPNGLTRTVDPRRASMTNHDTPHLVRVKIILDDSIVAPVINVPQDLHSL